MSFYALVLDADYKAPKPLIALHVQTQQSADAFDGIDKIDPWNNYGMLDRSSFTLDIQSTKMVQNSYSNQQEAASVLKVTHK